MIRGSSVRQAIRAGFGKRSLSTATSQTRYTTLNNGVVVATEINPNAQTSSLGVYFGAGSRSEHPYSNGIAALTTNILGGQSKSGVVLSTENKRELNGIIAQSTNENVNEAGKVLGSIVSNYESVLQKADLNKFKSHLLHQAQALENNPSKKVLEHLNATAFQGYSLGLPVLGTSDSIPDLQIDDSLRLLEKHFVATNIVIAGSGNFNHDSLVDSIESQFKVKSGLKPQIKPASFLGSEIRMRDDTLPKAYVAIGVEGEGIDSPAYYIAKVAAAVFGDFDCNSTLAHFTSPKLASIVQDYHIVDKYTHFSHSYSDTGLWGFNAEISNITSVDEFTHFALKQWNRLSISISNAEIARAKAQVKTALLAELNTPNAIVSDIATKVLSVGHRTSVQESLERIDSITTKQVMDWAKVALWDRDIVVSGTGQIEGLLDYGRNRNEMAMMRW